jgi:PadR family transcriptional regulator, regulatory protein AphA
MDADLSDTEYAVLGLLTFGDRSGYELDKLARRSIGYFWRPAKSKIYGILPRLVDRGFAERTRIAQTTRPDKHVYRLTPHGRAALDEWITGELPTPAVARDGLLLKLFFGSDGRIDALRAQLEARRDRGVSMLRELEEIERTIDRDEDFFPYLTLLHGLEDARSTIAWADHALAELDRRAEHEKTAASRA